MMQASASTNSHSPFGFLLILALLGIIGVMAYNILANQTANTVLAIETTTVDGVEVVVEDGGWSHRTREHAEDVETVDKCLKGNNWTRTYKQDGMTIIRVCIMKDTGEVIFQILQKRLGQLWEKTAFVKDELCAEDLASAIKLMEKWMSNHQYTRIINLMKFIGITK